MTWLEFKNCVESKGLLDSDCITMIDWKDYDAQPAVLRIIPGFAKIVQDDGQKLAELKKLEEILSGK